MEQIGSVAATIQVENSMAAVHPGSAFLYGQSKLLDGGAGSYERAGTEFCPIRLMS
jgi:hypothetical protein